MTKNERILAIAEKVKTNWDLMDFMGSCEKETLTAQTIQACKTNLRDHGEAFSFHAVGGDDVRMGVRNGSQYCEMVRNGYFVEGEFQGRVTIIPTEKLLDRLEVYLQRG